MIANPLDRIDAVPDDATLALNAAIDAGLANAPPGYTVEPAVLRADGNENFRRIGAAEPPGEDRMIQGPAGALPIRVFVPPEVRGVYLYLHGGAWMIGAHDCFDGLLWPRARDASVAIVSVGYRLAPEAPWPACADDCEAAALWLANNAAAEFGTDRLVIGGESAGAHLSAVTLLRLRDKHGMTPFHGAELRYGLYDMRLTPSMRNWQGRMLDRPTVEWHIEQLLGPRGAATSDPREDPDLSPLLADLHDMPRALFTVGTADGLLDDTVFMWARWRAAGNQADLRISPGGVHAFDLMPTPAAGEATAEINAFIRSCTTG